MGRPALHDRNYWAVHIAKQKSSGLTVAEYCHQHGFAVHQFYYGRRRALQDQLATAQREEPRGQSLLPRRDLRAAATKPKSCANLNQPIGSPQVIAKELTDKPASQPVSVVTIQFGGEAEIRIPANLLSTIDAVIGMMKRLEAHTPQVGRFRPIIVSHS